MSRKADLEQHIRESYNLIREYEDIIQASSEPKEKARSRRTIEEQWSLIEGYLAEYRRLAGESWPADIAEISARFARQGGQPQGTTPLVTASSPPDRATYDIHIQHAQGLAIGDGALVVQPSQPRAVPPDQAGGDEAPLASNRRERLEQRRRELQTDWSDLTTRIEAVRRDLGLEMDAERELVLQRRLEELEARRARVETDLESIEEELE